MSQVKGDQNFQSLSHGGAQRRAQGRRDALGSRRRHAGIEGGTEPGDGARRRQGSETDRARLKDAKWSKEEEVEGERYVGGRGDARTRARKGERGARFERAGGAAGGPGLPDRGEAVPDADSEGRAL